MEDKKINQNKTIPAYFDKQSGCCCFMIVSILVAFIGFFFTLFISEFNIIFIIIYLIISLGILVFFFSIARWDSGQFCENCNRRIHPLFKEHLCENVINEKKIIPMGGKISFKLHKKVKEVSLELFNNQHYAQAVFESVKALNNYVKNKAGITDRDLSDAMAKAFNEKMPIIKLNKLKTQSDLDEQRGFKFLFMGAMTGIRNPMGHEIYELEKNLAIEYLSFLSLLFRKAEEGKL